MQKRTENRAGRTGDRGWDSRRPEGRRDGGESRDYRKSDDRSRGSRKAESRDYRKPDERERNGRRADGEGRDYRKPDDRNRGSRRPEGRRAGFESRDYRKPDDRERNSRRASGEKRDYRKPDERERNGRRAGGESRDYRKPDDRERSSRRASGEKRDYRKPDERERNSRRADGESRDYRKPDDRERSSRRASGESRDYRKPDDREQSGRRADGEDRDYRRPDASQPEIRVSSGYAEDWGMEPENYSGDTAYASDFREPAAVSGHIEGRNAVLEAFRSGKTIDRLLIQDGCQDGPIQSIKREARRQETLVEFVPKERLDHISETGKHQGVIAFAAAYDYAEVEDILEAAKENGEQPFLILLDGIEDPHNLGAIIRTANLAGAHGVIIPKRRAVGLTSGVARASAGALNYTPVARVTNLAQTIEELKKQGIWFACAAMDAKPVYQANLTGSIGLVIGGEGDGVSRLVREKCDFEVSIPMKGDIDSLNASVAAGVLAFEIARQRENAGKPVSDNAGV